jgi:hypothetical protein
MFEGFEAWVPAVAAVFFSLFLPYIVQLVKRGGWSKKVNWVIAVAVSLVAGVFTALISGAPTPETFALWVAAVVGGVQAAYNLFKAIGVTDEWLDKFFYFASDDDAKLPVGAADAVEDVEEGAKHARKE